MEADYRTETLSLHCFYSAYYYHSSHRRDDFYIFGLVMMEIFYIKLLYLSNLNTFVYKLESFLFYLICDLSLKIFFYNLDL